MMYFIKDLCSICIYTSNKMQSEDKSILFHRSTISIRVLNCQKLLKLIFQLSNTSLSTGTEQCQLTELVFTELASNVNYSKYLMYLKTWTQLYRDIENWRQFQLKSADSLIILKCSLKLGPQCLETTRITVLFIELWPGVLNRLNYQKESVLSS